MKKSIKFGDILRTIRKEHNLTQAELAMIFDWKTSTISNYETRGYLTTMENMVKIAEYFDVSLDYLVFGIKNEESIQKKSGDSGKEEKPKDSEIMNLKKIIELQEKTILLLEQNIELNNNKKN